MHRLLPLAIGLTFTVVSYTLLLSTRRFPSRRPPIDCQRLARISLPSIAPRWISNAENYLLQLLLTVSSIIAIESLSKRFTRKRSLKVLLVVVLGGAFQFCVGSFAKLWFGSLRPDFLAVCQPKPSCGNDTRRIIPEYRCDREFDYQVRKSTMSFPSGHSVFAMFCFYLVAARWWRCRRVCGELTWRHAAALPLMMLVYATWISLSRVEENRHRLEDVVGGMPIGLFCGFLLERFALDVLVPAQRDDVVVML